MLDPVQRSLTEFLGSRSELFRALNLFESLAGENLLQLPARQMQSSHARPPASLANQSRLPRSVKHRLAPEDIATLGALIKPRKPPAEANRPERKIADRHHPIPRSFDFASR
jgi:hypothetical protein